MKKYVILIVCALFIISGLVWVIYTQKKQMLASAKKLEIESRKPASFEESKNQKDSSPLIRPSFHVHHFSTTGATGYSPTQIRNAYEMNLALGTGAGQTIAIIDAFGNPNMQRDLNIFNKHFGLPAIRTQIYYPQGKPTTTDSSWALETSLDVEWAHAIAPGANLMLVVAKEATYDDLLSAVDFAVSKGATQVSMSWGSGEFASETSLDFHFSNPKVNFFASSGDGGTGILWPAASPFVTAVGGTTLFLDRNGALTQPEMAWPDSGGGESVYEAQPTFQSQIQTSGRGVPDVSYNADPSTGFPVYDSIAFYGQSGWIQVGGTSAGAPQWAALIAVANSQRKAPAYSLNSVLYKLGHGPSYTQDFRDIITGCNGAPTNLTCARSGYDFVTGLGTPLRLRSSNL